MHTLRNKPCIKKPDARVVGDTGNRIYTLNQEGQNNSSWLEMFDAALYTRVCVSVSLANQLFTQSVQIKGGLGHLPRPEAVAVLVCFLVRLPRKNINKKIKK